MANQEQRKNNDHLFAGTSYKEYKRPDIQYDEDLAQEFADDKYLHEMYIDTLPDLQNGPESLIKGEPVLIEQVGIHNFKLPIKYATKEGSNIQLETSVTGTVSLEAHKKGINMSRIMRSFYKFEEEVFTFETLKDILLAYKEDLNTFEANVELKFSYPIRQKSLRSGNSGWQYYDVSFEATMDSAGTFKPLMHFDFVYSSACPCSYELAQHALENRFKAGVPHSQRSVMRISVEVDEGDSLWIEDLHQLALNGLKTETQVVVKREDEQAFAELNGSYLKFVEDAVRIAYKECNSDPRILDFKIVASHQESLHSHDAVASICKGVQGGFTAAVDRATWNSLIHTVK